MGDRIKGMRQQLGAVAFGVLDGDFRELRPVTACPSAWEIEGELFGWRWERKEIENYLLDPQVVGRVFSATEVSPAEYLQVLKEASEQIAVYEAARTQLGFLQRLLRPLDTSFGRPHGHDKHLFPDSLDKASCQTGLREVIGKCQATVAFDEGRFGTLLHECAPDGPRGAEFLSYFAGKDLMWAMNDSLRQFGIENCGEFRERILVGIEETKESVQEWVPEWLALREEIRSLT